jgi:ATP-dependent RNA helicase RhlE
MSFKELGLPEQLLVNIDKLGYSKVYPIQKEAIPVILKGEDLLGIAKTGSGKTASFALPILANLQKKFITKNRHINVLVLVPTRELAIQVSETFTSLSKNLNERIKTLAVFGGVSINPQMIALQHVNILVATPGRLLDLTASKALHLDSVQTLVLDEADKMLNLGFKDEMDAIFKLLPVKRQNLLFSATLNSDLSEIKAILLNNPVTIEIKEEETIVASINQVGYFVKEKDRGPLLRYLIQYKGLNQVLVFISSSHKADHVAHKLRKNGIDAESIHGKKSQTARKELLEDFKRGRLRVLVATDLLSRGIDINELPCVINYDLPRSPKDYVHRIGRTGRADANGEAITFVSEEDKHHFKIIQKKMCKIVDMIDSENIENL